MRPVTNECMKEVQLWATPKKGSGKEYSAGVAPAKVIVYATSDSAVYKDEAQPAAGKAISGHPLLRPYANGQRPHIPDSFVRGGALCLPCDGSASGPVCSDLDGSHRLKTCLAKNSEIILGSASVAELADSMSLLWRVAVNVLVVPLETVTGAEEACAAEKPTPLMLSGLLREYAMTCAKELNVATSRSNASTGSSKIITTFCMNCRRHSRGNL